MDNELLVREAARAGVVVEPLPSETEYCGVYVRDLNDGQEVWVVRMIFTWRILETHALGYGRFWCYPLEAFRVAVTHASLYGDGEPDGWIKSWDGRRATPTHESEARDTASSRGAPTGQGGVNSYELAATRAKGP